MPQQPLRNESLTELQSQPTGLDLALAEQVLRIDWADGVTSAFPAHVLRRSCPCASCRTEREKQSQTLLPIMTSAPTGELRFIGGHLVGKYALQLEWSDGHATGIYDFKLLRTLHEESTRV